MIFSHLTPFQNVQLCPLIIYSLLDILKLITKHLTLLFVLKRRFSRKDVITAYPIPLVRSCIFAHSSQTIEQYEGSYDKAEVVNVLILFFFIAIFKPSLFHHFDIKTSFEVCWAEPTTTCKYYMLNLKIDWVTSKDKICNHNFNYNGYQVM